MSKSKLGVFSIIVLLLLSFTISLVAAQYTPSKTTNFNIGIDGTRTVSESEIGVTYVLQGTPGSNGSVTASVFGGNPQVTASIPEHVSLNHFIAIVFDMSSSDFKQAQITISYSDSDVANLQKPYSVYKYFPDTDSFVQLPTTVDTDAKTMTVTINSVNDNPLLAIGGLAVEESRVTTSSWIILVVSVIVIVVLTVFIVVRWRKL
jgi:hypothetical protein